MCYIYDTYMLGGFLQIAFWKEPEVFFKVYMRWCYYVENLN